MQRTLNLLFWRRTTTLRCASAAMLDRAAAARREIFDLWQAQDSTPAADRQQAVRGILDRYRMTDANTTREDDVTRGLGDALDRLLLLTVPLGEGQEPVAAFETVLRCAGRAGRDLSVRTIQQLLSRTANYGEAMALFYAMRKANVNMSMEGYYAMLYSLQRLEEESWCRRFAEDMKKNNGRSSEEALDFIVKGTDSPLLPENKPWLGRVMYHDVDKQSSRKQGKVEVEALHEQWVKRYQSGK